MKNKSSITVTKTYLPKKEVFLNYIDQIYESNWLTNFGKLHNTLEIKLKEYLNVENLTLVSNGTHAIQLALRVLPSSKKTVITTPFSFVATTSSIIWEGFTAQFADIDPATLNLDPNKTEDILKVNSDIRAILPVHVYGNACDVEAFEFLSQKYSVPVIYDSAHAFGVKYNDRSLLSYGEMSTLSFHSTKIFHTIEGGAIISRTPLQAKSIRSIINFGISGPDRIDDLGINCKMNEFQAAMGLSVLAEMENINSERERVFNLYMESINPELVVPIKHRGSKNFSYFPILFKTENSMIEAKEQLSEQGIHSRRYFYPSLSQLSYLPTTQSTPIANDISSRILCLPFYPSLEEADIKNICNVCNNAYE